MAKKKGRASQRPAPRAPSTGIAAGDVPRPEEGGSTAAPSERAASPSSGPPDAPPRPAVAPRSGATDGDRPRRAAAHLPPTALPVAAVVVAITALLYYGLLSTALTDLDTYPLLAAARLESFGDVFRLFGAPLMDGRMPQGDFYRPLSTLTLGLDHALWGLAPRGYHVTDLLLHLASCAAMFGFVRALLGWANRLAPQRALGPRACEWMAAIATVLFALHPVHQEIVPAIARRPEILHGLFALLSLRSFFRYLVEPTRRDTVLTVLCFALAFLSKDSGVLVPGFFAIAGVIELAHRGLGKPQVERLTLLAIYTGLVGGLLLVWRFKVLGGMGGYAYSKLVTPTQVFEAGAGELGRVMLYPIGDHAISLTVLAALAAAGIGLAVLAALWRRRALPFAASGAAVSFLVAATALQLALYVYTRTYLESRTLYTTAAMLATLSAWALVSGIYHVRPLAQLARRLPAVAVAALGVWLVAMNIASGLDRRALSTWAPAAALGERAAVSLVEELRDLPAGSTVCMVNAPFSVGPPLSTVRKRYLLLDYSVQGLLDLIYGEGHFHVIGVSYVGSTTTAYQLTTKVSAQDDTLIVSPSPGAALLRFPFPRLRLPEREPGFAPGPGPKTIALAGTACSVQKNPLFAVFDGTRFRVSLAR